MVEQNDDGGADAGGTGDVQDPAAAVTDAEAAPAPVSSIEPIEDPAGVSGWQVPDADRAPWAAGCPGEKRDDDLPPPIFTPVPVDPALNPSKW